MASMYIALLGRFVFYQLKTGVYTRTVLKLYSSLQENFTLHQG